jgi:hypothetical protein
MVTRPTHRVAAVAWLAVWGCGPLPDDPLPVGSRFPLAVAGTAAEVVWVVRPDDYLTCQTAAGGLRELQRQVGSSVPLTVVYVGPHASWLEEFLHRQRIAATIVPMDEGRFRRAFHRNPGPWLYLLSDGVVRGVLPGGGEVRPAKRWSELINAARGRQRVVNPSQGARP